MRRLKSKAGGLDSLVGKVTVHYSRLSEFRYVVIFNNMERVHGKKVALVYPNRYFRLGKIEGFFTGVNPNRVSGKTIGLSEVPTQIIEDIKRNL